MKKVLLCIGLLVSLSHSSMYRLGKYEEWYINQTVNAKVKVAKKYYLVKFKGNMKNLEEISHYDSLGRITLFEKIDGDRPILKTKYSYKGDFLSEIEWGKQIDDGKYEFLMKQRAFRNSKNQIDSIQSTILSRRRNRKYTDTHLIFHPNSNKDSLLLNSTYKYSIGQINPTQNTYLLIEKENDGTLKSYQYCKDKALVSGVWIQENVCQSGPSLWDYNGRYRKIKQSKNKSKQSYMLFDKNDNLIESGTAQGKKQGWYYIYEFEYYQ